MRWGFIRPFNACINNARADKIAERNSMWAPAWENLQRCLIPAAAFYEWSGPKGKKQAHRIRPKNLAKEDHMWIAGIWEESHEGLRFSMLTTTANQAMAPIHHRMPVILEPLAIDEYLEADDPMNLLIPFAGILETPSCQSPFRKEESSFTQLELL